MAADGSIIIDTRINTGGFNKGAANLKTQFAGLGSSVKKLGGLVAAAFSVSQIIAFSKEAIALGSDLQEVQNVVDVTFTTMNEQINEFAKNAAKTAGISETMAKRYAGTFGAMAKSFKFTEEEAYNMSTALTQMAGDVASFYNITQDEAYTKLKSVFTGETESLKDLGVVMTQTALDDFALRKGLKKTTSQMTEQEKVALRYQFVLEQLNGASGDFLRTSDSWANQTRLLSLQFDTLKATIGQGLINALTPAIKVINEMIAKFQVLADSFLAFTEKVFGSAGGAAENTAEKMDALNESIKDAAATAKKALAPFDEIIKIGENKNGDIYDTQIPGSIPGGGGNTLPSGSADWLNVSIDNIEAKLRGLWESVAPFAQEWYENAKSYIHTFGAEVNEIFNKLKEKSPEFNRIWAGLLDIGAVIKKVLDPINELVQKIRIALLQNLGEIVSATIDGLVDSFAGLVDFVAGVFTGDWSRALKGLKDLALGWANGTIGYINAMVKAAVDGLNVVIDALNAIGTIELPNWSVLGDLAGESFGINIPRLTAPKIPYLAKGAVIPPNAPFAAILGDQKHGTNIEAPLSTIQEAVALVMEDHFAGMMTGFEEMVAVLREILEAVYGIQIGDEVIAQAVGRYNRKMNTAKGGA